MRRLIAILLSVCLLGGTLPAFAAEADQGASGEAAQVLPLPAWAYGVLADGYAMGLFGDEIYTSYASPITQEQLSDLTGVVADKLALLEVEPRQSGGDALVVDTTRGGVMNALYQEAAAYAFPNVEEGAEAFMTRVGAVAGTGAGLQLDRTCTVLEAVTMANSLVLALYDQMNAGSLGLLWKAENGAGNTLYLLGSIHLDRNNVYPVHKQLRDIITSAEQVSFELDFNDQAGMAELAAMQTYSDGTTLADHISPELYQVVVETAGQMGMEEEQVSQYKAWTLASSFQTLAMMDETTGSNAMAIDLYVNAKAVNAGADIGAVETYAFQGGIFDSLSPEYQEVYLAGALLMLLGNETMSQDTQDTLAQILGDEALSEDTQQAVEEELALAGKWMEQWKSRDVEGFAKSYDKQAILTSGDELESKLFLDRDPGMIAYADRYLKQEGSHTGLLVVGAGHMIGETGVVQGLIDLGYTVEVVPVP